MKFFNFVMKPFRFLKFLLCCKYVLMATFFRSKYIKVYEYTVTKLVKLVNRMMRKLIVMKGKDPDYVAPPPPVVEAQSPWASPYKLSRTSPYSWAAPYMPSWVAPSFKDRTKHILYKSPPPAPPVLSPTIVETPVPVVPAPKTRKGKRK